MKKDVCMKKLPKLPRGQGSMTYIRDGKYVRYRKKIKLENLVEKQLSVTEKTPSECLEAMKALENSVRSGYIPRAKKPLGVAMLEWVELSKKPSLKPQSYTRIKSTVCNQIVNSEIGNLVYRGITSEELRRYLNSLNTEKHYSYSTIKKTYDALNEFYREKSEEEGFNNPMKSIKKIKSHNVIKETKDIVFFEEEDIKKFISAAVSTYSTGTPRYRYGAVLAANLFLGLRVGELLALKWEDIDFEKRCIRVNKTLIYEEVNNAEYKSIAKIQTTTKTSVNRFVPINDDAYKLLQLHYERAEYKEPDDFVVCTRNRRTSTIMDISDTILCIEKKGNTKLRYAGSHVLRHTCASLYFKKNVPIQLIASILGNSVEVCAQTYVHLIEEQRQEAASNICLPRLE